MRISLLTIIATLIAIGNAHANPQRSTIIVRGHVVEKIDNEVYLSIGSNNQVVKNAPVRFKHPLELKHPITRALVSDWLPVGQALVGHVEPQLSVVVATAELGPRIQIGDIAEVLVFGSPKPVVTKAVEKQSKPLPSLDAETLAVLRLWRQTTGQPLVARISMLTAFLREHPGSPFVAAVQEDLALLYQYKTSIADSSSAAPAPSVTLEHTAPTHAQAHTTIPLIFKPDIVEEVSSAWLHYRLRGAATFKRTPLKLANNRYLRGNIPSAITTGSAVEYFVGLATTSGSHGDAIGSARDPIVIKIDAPTYHSPFPEEKGRTRMSFSTTFLDFATFDSRDGNRTDYLTLVEGDVLYRVRKKSLYGIRTGFGVAQGRGGYKNRSYSDEAPVSAYQYGFSEFEFRGASSTAFIARVAAGSGETGFVMGGRVRVRVGHEDQSNLRLGLGVLPGIGFLTDLRMQWDAIESMPIGLAVGLTDQPSEGDLAVRFTTDVGWRALSWFQPTLRISYQGRSVRHSGLGIGLGVVFDW